MDLEFITMRYYFNDNIYDCINLGNESVKMWQIWEGKRIKIQSTSWIIDIPAMSLNGDILKIENQGHFSQYANEPCGDLLVQINVLEDHRYQMVIFVFVKLCINFL